MSERETYTEITSESWFDRVRESIKGVGTGLLFVVIAFPLLFWNEGRAVRTARGLQEGAGAVVSVKPERVDPANEGKLIHTSGLATTSETLKDEAFGVSAPGLKLIRQVEMFQWKQTEKKRKQRDGSRETTVTTYEYETGWFAEKIDSSRFKKALGHENPQPAHESRSILAEKVMLGAIQLPATLVDRLGGGRELPVTNEMWFRRDSSRVQHAWVIKGAYFLGRFPSRPEVGDLRVSYRVVEPSVAVSVVAKQTAGTLGAYQTSAGGTIELLQMGTVDAQAMFKTALAGNAKLTWILRGVGLALLFFGLLLIFNPLAVLADLIPFVGDLLRFGVAAFAGLTSLALGGLTIAAAWIVQRPLLGVPLLVGSLGLIVGLKLLGRSRKPARAQGAPPRPALSNS